MPICDGIEATRRIRTFENSQPAEALPASHYLNGRVPILAVSASLHEDQRPKISEAGLDGYLLKPISFARMAEMLSGCVDAQSRSQNLYQPGRWERGGWLRKGSESPRLKG